MRKILTITTLIFIFVVTLGMPLGQVYAWIPGKGYGTDNDAAKKENQMSSAPWTANELANHQLGLACSVFPFFGEDNCTADREIQQAMLHDSAIGNISTGIAIMYAHPPADLAYWIRDTGQSLGFIPNQAYAQGIGFNGLAPLLPIWKAFRNIAYALLALAMVVVGFMVMMRKRIDPKTVVTVQNSLPRIVIALILITFSYAIVGLFIDIMYLSIAFLHFIVQANLPDTFNPVSPLVRVNYVSGGFFDLLLSVFSPLLRWYPGEPMRDIVQGDVIEGLIGGIISPGLVAGPLFLVILGLAYLYAFVRILFLLLGSYIQVILAVLTAPIQILADVFPGSNAFGEWIKNLVANLVVFPLTVFFLMIANVITQYIGDETLWTPPLLPQAITLPVVGTVGGTGGIAEVLIVLGIVMTIPNVVNSIKEGMKAKQLVDAGPGVIFGPLARGAGSAMQGAYQISMISTGIGTIGNLFNKGGSDPHSSAKR